MFNNYPDLLNIEEACEIMHMSRNTLYELLRNKDIKAFQVNRIWKIPREAIEEYCRRQSGLYKTIQQQKAQSFTKSGCAISFQFSSLSFYVVKKLPTTEHIHNTRIPKAAEVPRCFSCGGDISIDYTDRNHMIISLLLSI